MPRRPRLSQRAIAKACGVSQSLVWAILNDKVGKRHRCSEATKEAVWRLAEAQGHRHPQAAPVYDILMLTPSLAVIPDGVYDVLSAACTEAGLRLHLLVQKPGNRVPELLREGCCDAVVLWSAMLLKKCLKTVLRLGLPHVAIASPNYDGPSLRWDERPAWRRLDAWMAAHELSACWYLAPHHEEDGLVPWAQDRCATAKATLTDQRRVCMLPYSIGPDVDEEAHIRQALAAIKPGSLLLLQHSDLAPLAYETLRQAGLEPGRDVAVVGVHKRHRLALSPELATIAFDAERFSANCVIAIQRLIAGAPLDDLPDLAMDLTMAPSLQLRRQRS